MDNRHVLRVGRGCTCNSMAAAHTYNPHTCCAALLPRPLQGFVRSTTKYWVRAEDVSVVKYHILQVRVTGRGGGGCTV